MTRTVFVEESKTPIYRRIAHALGAELTRCGLEVFVVKPDGFNSTTFREFVSKQGASAYISNSVGNIIQAKLPEKEEYFFESFPGKLIFLHQDAILGGFPLLKGISKLQAWKRVAERSAHLCIEPNNVAELATVGIPNAKIVPHATEISPQEPCIEDFQYGSTFVGHAIPSMYRPVSDSHRLQNLIDETLELRRTNLANDLSGCVTAYVDNTLNGVCDAADHAILKVAHSQWVRSQITGQTMPFRGWCFENCELQPMTIFGGDPAYLHSVARDLQIDRPGVNYHPAVYEPNEVQRIFRQSKININVSSMQFDYAVVNRFHDVIMSGGLCLTDARSGLADLTSSHEDVSFRTLDELRDRAEYFSRPENAQQRALLIKSIQKDIANNSGYPLLAKTIISTLQEL